MSLLDNIQNYYETLVLESLADMDEARSFDEDTQTDIICIALNHLPPRYISHSIDMVYYTSPQEREELAKKAETAVKDAIAYVKKNDRA